MRNVTFRLESWATKFPFSTAIRTVTEVKILTVTLTENGVSGRGEATGIHYLGESSETILAQAESVKKALQQGIDREALRTLLPAGGARNAIDCPLWDLQAKLSDKTIWELTAIAPTETNTVYTVSIDTPEVMAASAKKLDTSKIKVKLDGKQPLACIEAVCDARPDAEVVVDVNQGWNFKQLVELAPKFKRLGIIMIEQPLPRGADTELETYYSPIPLCADESCLDTSELEQASQRYQMINIKLDKTGGLTEALELAKQAKALGLGLMVGNMLGTSLAMAPAFVVAQLCQLADLDGPVLLKNDRLNAMSFDGGMVSPPIAGLWG